VTPDGPIDAATVTLLRHHLSKVLQDPHPRVVINLWRVPSYDPAGLQLLEATIRRAKEQGGWARLAKPHPHLQPRLLAARLTAYASIAAALND
jgi:anti-anti-sigma factor